MAGLVRSVPRRQILPGCAGTQNPEHTIEHPACIAPGATASIPPPLLVPLYQGPEMFPLPVAEISHAPDLLQLRP